MPFVARLWTAAPQIVDLRLPNLDEAELPPDHPNLSMALTYADLTRLVVASIEAPPKLRFGIFHGVSNSRWKRLDISDAHEVLGYAPQDDTFALVERRAS
jgi:hypothetical protein